MTNSFGYSLLGDIDWIGEDLPFNIFLYIFKKGFESNTRIYTSLFFVYKMMYSMGSMAWRVLVCSYIETSIDWITVFVRADFNLLS